MYASDLTHQKRAAAVFRNLQLQKEWFTKEEFNAATVAPRSNCVLNIDKLSAIYQLQHVTAALDTAVEKLPQVR